MLHTNTSNTKWHETLNSCTYADPPDLPNFCRPSNNAVHLRQRGGILAGFYGVQREGGVTASVALNSVTGSGSPEEKCASLHASIRLYSSATAEFEKPNSLDPLTLSRDMPVDAQEYTFPIKGGEVSGAESNLCKFEIIDLIDVGRWEFYVENTSEGSIQQARVTLDVPMPVESTDPPVDNRTSCSITTMWDPTAFTIPSAELPPSIIIQDRPTVYLATAVANLNIDNCDSRPFNIRIQVDSGTLADDPELKKFEG